MDWKPEAGARDVVQKPNQEADEPPKPVIFGKIHGIRFC